MKLPMIISTLGSLFFSLCLLANPIERLQKAISFQTIVSDQGPQQPQEFIGFQEFLKASFPLTFSHYQLEYLKDYSLLLRPKSPQGDRPNYLFIAHYDVVPVVSPDNWDKPPFAAQIEGGYLYGRGALDDKSSVLGLLEAREELLKEKKSLPINAYFAFGHDEEVNGLGAKAIAAQFKKEGLLFDMVLDEGGAIVEGKKLKVKKNIALVGIAEKGFLKVHLEVTGHSGHSSRPPAQTVIDILSTAIVRLEKLDFSVNLTEPVVQMLKAVGPAAESPFIGWVFSYADFFKPILTFVLNRNPDTQPMIKTLKATTMIQGGVKINQIPEKAEVSIMFRTLPGEEKEGIIERIKAVVADERVKVYYEEHYSSPKQISRTDSVEFKKIKQAILNQYPDIVVAPYLTMAAVDARSYEEVSQNTYRILPVEMLGDDLGSIHGDNERISLESYKKLIAIYKDIMSLSLKD